jgi:hypothetical protein
MSDSSTRRGVDVAEVTVASAWLGAAMLFVAVVAPASFSVLPTRALAGALVGAVLPALFYSGIVAGLGFVFASLAGDRRRIVTAGTVGGLLIAVSCGAAQFVVAPRIERVRAAIPGTIESLPASDVRRVSFGRLHAASVLWLGVAAIGAATVATGAAASLRRTT